MKSLEPENLDVPFGRSFDVAHAHGYVINTFELHEMLDRMCRIYRIAQVETIKRCEDASHSKSTSCEV